jgi:hypothetical protein
MENIGIVYYIATFYVELTVRDRKEIHMHII